MLAEKVESLCGFRPESDLVDAFLSKQARGGDVIRPSPTRVRPREKAPVVPGTPPDKELGFEFRGRFHPARNHRDLMLQVFRLLSAEDTSFLNRFAARSLTGRARRPKLARSRHELFPGNEALAQDTSHSAELNPGADWYVDVNQSASSIRQTIKTACEVAGVSFGDELRII